MQKIVGIKKSEDKNIYYFLQNIDVSVGDKVVADFGEFLTIGTVCKVDVEADKDKAQELKSLTRKASEADIKKYESLKEKANSQLKQIKAKSLELGLMMKFVGAEYSLDNSKIMIVFSSEERVDFRQFLKDLATMLKTRIELKQIGQRDEIKICGGVGPCGQPCCCARFLDDFEHVTVKMAKVQGLSLSPTKINGICGRLMCCLGYEAENYEQTLAKMPKVGSEVFTPNGKGTVVYNDILRERVSVKRQADGDSFVVEDFALEELGENKKPIKKEHKHEEHELALQEEKQPVEKQEQKQNNGEQKQPNEKKHGKHRHFHGKNKPKPQN